MCETMEIMTRDTEQARAECYRNTDQHLQMLFGQWALVGEQMKRFHADRCEACKEADAFVPEVEAEFQPITNR